MRDRGVTDEFYNLMEKRIADSIVPTVTCETSEVHDHELSFDEDDNCFSQNNMVSRSATAQFLFLYCEILYSLPFIQFFLDLIPSIPGLSSHLANNKLIQDNT